MLELLETTSKVRYFGDWKLLACCEYWDCQAFQFYVYVVRWLGGGVCLLIFLLGEMFFVFSSCSSVLLDAWKLRGGESFMIQVSGECEEWAVLGVCSRF